MGKTRILLITTLLFVGYVSSQAQQKNLQSLTPSFILAKGQIEAKPFFNLYTQTSFYDATAVKIVAGQRASYFTTILQTLYGLTSRVNIGVDAFIKGVEVGPTSLSSLHSLRFPNTPPNSRAAITKIGPRIKMQLGKKSTRLSFQSTVYLPVTRDLQGLNTGGPYLDHDGFFWWTQFFSDNKLGKKLNVFLELDVLANIDRQGKAANSTIGTPLKVFLSHFATSRFSWYYMTDFTTTYGSTELFSSFYWQQGIGVKYQLNSSLEIELLHTEFIAGKSAGAGKTFNLGLRFVK